MLFAWRGKEKGYGFRLATEMTDAMKFDDVTFHYMKPRDDKLYIRFLQAKHIQDESTTISAKQLLTDTSDDRFLMTKYFDSFCKIRQNPKFSSGVLDYVLCTNIGLDFDLSFKDRAGTKKLNGVDLYFEQIPDDDLLNINGGEYYRFSSQSCYRNLIKQCLGDKLKKAGTTELVSVLVKHILEGTSITLKNKYFKEYHTFLIKHILDNDRLAKDFLNNQIDNKVVPGIEAFRGIFKETLETYIADTLKKSKKLTPPQDKLVQKYGQNVPKKRKIDNTKQKVANNDIWNDIVDFKINVSEGFKEKILPESKSDVADTSDATVDAYLDSLIFAVKQPNEQILGALINDSIGKEFNVIDSDLITNTFLNLIMDWMKTKQGLNEYITENQMYSFFQEMLGKITKYIALGISLEHIEKIEKPMIYFEERSLPKDLVDFIEDLSCGTFYYRSIPDASILGEIKINQIIKRYQHFKRHGSYFYFCNNSLMQLENQIKSCSTIRDSLVVMECTSGYIPKNIIHEQNKIIIIFPADIDLNNCNVVYEYYDSVQFQDFTESSKKAILNKQIIFQGQEVALSELLFDHYDEVLDATTVARFFENDLIRIELETQRQHDLDRCYVRRKLNLKKLDVRILDDIESKPFPDVFVINNYDYFQIRQTRNEVYSFSSQEEQSVLAKEKFQELCEETTMKNIHWLEYCIHNISLKCTYGSISNIQHYKVEKTLTDIDLIDYRLCIDEDDLVDNKYNSICLISDTAGMGKSAILSSLEQLFKARDKSVWIIRLDLNDYTHIFDEELIKSQHSRLNAIDFIATRLIPKKLSEFELKLFKQSFNHKKVVVMFDGFDEICPDYNNIVLELLTNLKTTNLYKMFVTTRPHVNKELETALGQFAITIEPFNNDNQIQFLTSFWMKGLCLEPCDVKKVEEYAHILLTKIKVITKINEKEFSCIPLQLKLLAVVFQNSWKDADNNEWDGCREFVVNNKPNAVLPERLYVLDLFDNFVKEKFYSLHYVLKKKLDLTKTSLRKEYERDIFPLFYKNHEKLALHTVLNIKHWEYLGATTKFNIELDYLEDLLEDNKGIIDQIIDGRAHFVHRTFAEYFVAKFIIRELPTKRQHIVKFLIKCVLKDPQFKIVRSFLDQTLSRDSSLFNILDTIDSALIEDWQLSLQDNKNIAHVSAEEGTLEILKALGFAMQSHLIIFNEIIHQYFDGKAAIHNAAINNHWNLVKYMIEEFNVNVNLSDSSGKTILFQAVERNDMDIVKWLVNKGANINVVDSKSFSVLSTAIEKCTLELIQYLVIKKNVKICLKGKSEQNGTNRNAVSKRLDVLSWFVEKGFTRGIIASIARSASYLGQQDVVQYILDHSSGIGTQKTILSIAIKAISNDKVNIIKLLVNKFPKIFKRLKNLLSVLHTAAECGSIKIVKYLVEISNGDYDCPDDMGMTVLHKAAQCKNMFKCAEVVSYLNSLGMSVDFDDNLWLLPEFS